MNILNSFFEKIYVISSYPTQNRLNHLLLFLDKEDIQYELIISPQKKYFKDKNEDDLWIGKGAFSLLSANESIFLKEFYKKSESFCILEDDIYFDIDYKNKLTRVFKKLSNDWDILNLGFHKNTPINNKIVDGDIIYKLQKMEEIVGAHMVVYKKNVVSFVLAELEKNKLPMDWFLTKNVYSNFNTYTCVDKIFYASSLRKAEQNLSDYYTRYESEIGN